MQAVSDKFLKRKQGYFENKILLHFIAEALEHQHRFTTMLLQPGCGKTFLVLLIAGTFLEKGTRVCIITYNELLSQQMQECVNKYFADKKQDQLKVVESPHLLDSDDSQVYIIDEAGPILQY